MIGVNELKSSVSPKYLLIHCFSFILLKYYIISIFILLVVRAPLKYVNSPLVLKWT